MYWGPLDLKSSTLPNELKRYPTSAVLVVVLIYPNHYKTIISVHYVLVHPFRSENVLLIKWKVQIICSKCVSVISKLPLCKNSSIIKCKIMRKSNFDLFEPLLFFQTNPHVTKYLAAHVKGAISEFFFADWFIYWELIRGRM